MRTRRQGKKKKNREKEKDKHASLAWGSSGFVSACSQDRRAVSQARITSSAKYDRRNAPSSASTYLPPSVPWM
jgi:hypothetical protein